MSKVKFLLSLGLLICGFKSFSQKNFVIQETNIDKNKAAQFISAARRCEAVLLKNSPPTSLAFSNNSTLTNNSINNLSERFLASYPKSKPSSSTDRIIERVLTREKPNAVRFTYCFMQQGKYTTADFVQLTVIFDPGSPKIIDIQVKGKAETPLVTLTEREMNPPPPPPVQVAKKTPAKTQTKTTTKPKPKTKTTAPKKKTP